MTYPTNPESQRMRDKPAFFHLGPYAETPEWGALPMGRIDPETYEQLVRELPGLDAENDD